MEINITKINLNPNAGGGGKPIELQEKSITITENGTREITPDEDFGGLSSVKVKVDNSDLGKIKLPNGICLSGSTWETFDMGNYDWSEVTDWRKMFYKCTNLKTLYNVPTNITVSTMNGMLGETQIKQLPEEMTTWKFSHIHISDESGVKFFSNFNTLDGFEKWDVSPLDGFYSFGYSNITSLEPIANWDTSNFETLSSMFSGCREITSLEPIANWDTSNVTNMSNMFNGCREITSLEPIANWDTSNVTNMYGMFNECRQLVSVDLRGWDTSKVTDMKDMFKYCSQLVSADLRGWDFSKKPSVTGMFKDCSSITDIWIDGDLSYVNGLTVQNGFIPGLTNAGHRGTFHYNPQYDISLIRTYSSGWDFVPIE